MGNKEKSGLSHCILSDDDSHYQLYISDSSIDTLTDTDALIAGLTLGQNQNGVLPDQAFLSNLAADYYDTTFALSDVNTDSLMIRQEQLRVGVQVAAHENYTAAENAMAEYSRVAKIMRYFPSPE